MPRKKQVTIDPIKLSKPMILTEKVARRAIIICGGAKQRHSMRFEEMRDRPEVEFWGFNAMRFMWVPRWDRMFNVHKFALLKRYKWPIEREAQWAATHRDVPFYVADAWPDGWLPAQRIFPRDALNDMGVGQFDYHCNTVDWLIHFALFEGFDKIEVHGCNVAMHVIDEQMSARACIEYWTGVATGRGVMVQFFDSDLFFPYHVVRSNRVYGYDDCPAWEDRTRFADPDKPPYTFGDD